MTAEKIWGSNINAQLGTTNTVVRIIGAKDLSRIGIFAVETLSFNTYKSRTDKSYFIEVYEYQTQDGETFPVAVHFERFKNKTELKRAFKNFQLK